MKGVFYVALLAGFALQACKKEDVRTNSQASGNSATKNNNTSTKFERKGTPSSLRMYWNFDPWRSGCISMPENCLPDVIVRPRTTQMITVIETGSVKAVKDYFRKYYDDLGADIYDVTMDRVISGTYSVSIFSSTDPVEGSKYVIFKNASNAIKEVYPFIPE